MIVESNLGTFKYFLECYFNPSANWDELEKLIKDFCLSEKEMYILSLRNEVNLINKCDDWDAIHHFIKKYGMRRLTHEKIKQLVEIINKELSLKLGNLS